MKKTSVLQPEWRNTGLFKDRYAYLAPHVKGRTVLDVGCAVGYKQPNWMHAMIKEDASSILGIDIDQRSVSEIREKGYRVEYGDAQDFDLNQKFEVVHAGELIEHLDNFHGFLESVRRHMTSESRLVLTTPNAMRFNNFIYSTMGGLRVNAEHTCWFCADTITTLLERNHFEVEHLGYIRHKSKGAARKLISWISRLLLPERVAWNTLMVVARPNSPEAV